MYVVDYENIVMKNMLFYLSMVIFKESYRMEYI